MCELARNGRRKLVAVRLFCRLCAQAGMLYRVSLPPPTAVRPAHQPENKACCVWKKAAVKQTFKTNRFIVAKGGGTRCTSNRRSCALVLTLFNATCYKLFPSIPDFTVFGILFAFCTVLSKHTGCMKGSWWFDTDNTWRRIATINISSLKRKYIFHILCTVCFNITNFLSLLSQCVYVSCDSHDNIGYLRRHY